MGSGRSLQLHADCDSVVEPGTKVVQSEALELDFDQLFDEYLEQLRYPVSTIAEYVLKECSVEDHGPDDFSVKVVLCGKKLDSYGYGRGDGVDMIGLWTRVTGDRAKRHIRCQDTVQPPGCFADELEKHAAGGGAKTCFLEDPLRVEFQVELSDGSRLEDQEATKQILLGILGPAVSRVGQQLVKVSADQESTRGDGGRSVISGPLDEATDFDNLWERYVEAIKSPPGAAVAPEVVEVSDEEFHVILEIPPDTKLTTTVRHCKESGEILAVTTDGEEKVVSKTTSVLHREPLIVEVWGESRTGERQSGRGAARALQAHLESALAPKKSGWFW